MKTAAYIRISSSSQKTSSQKAEIKKWLHANKYDLKTVMWFEDQESGGVMERPALSDLKATIFAGEVNTVILWKLDRLARSQQEGINLLSEWCDRGIRIVSVTQQIDLSGAVGRLVAGVLFGIAEIEKQHIRERQAAGIALAKEKGIYTGRKSGTTKAKPERAKELKGRGLKNIEIAQALDVSPRTVANYLKQEEYKPE